jgi:enamine deaminase RidA (YjgF/YER057c/UK114 family)
MTLRAINPLGFNIPGISQAVLVEHGRLLLLSGHVPAIDANGAVASKDLETQLEQVFQSIEATLTSAGATFSDVARVTIYVRDYRPELLSLIRRARDRFIDTEQPPASALIGVASLFHPDVLVEIDAIAVLPA